MSVADLDLSAPSFRADPYSVYHRMRADGPVLRAADGDWLAFRHADVISVLRDPDTWSSDARNATGSSRRDRRAEIGINLFTGLLMLFTDPPDHTRLRGLVNKAFTPRAVEARRPTIAALVDRLLDDASERGEMDLLTDFAFPLPVLVIADMLGVPGADQGSFKEWSRDLARTIDPVVSDEHMARAGMAGMQFIQYLGQLIEERKRSPADDLLSALIAAEEEGDRLSHEELLANCILLFIAGHETTQNLIGNGTFALLRHRDQLERWQRDPGLTKTAVEELLRYDSPVQLTARTALRDTEVGGQPVARGDMVVTFLGAANRDPEVFSDPDRLDLGRQPNPHLAFGFGIHTCLGAPLARLETHIALPRLIGRFPDLTLAVPAGEIAYRDTTTLRGLTSLPVRWETA